mmetsp:Transcript_113381/g.315653  ORF Transcript_113381/g.315653 Transcript_113381/m.315653 type:complete len:435 (-) Transcript_113381:85-1389(-)
MATQALGAGRERASFSGNLTTGAIRRIQTEQGQLQRNHLYAENIVLSWGDQLHSCKALILGPPETPYQHGFYLFDIKYPDNYPWDAPHVDFKTGDQRVRLNPNLYVAGKVCLSILGTWSGPPWTPMMTLSTVLLSIQSLLHAHPLQNEPGFADCVGEKEQRYARMLSYESINVAVLRMLEQPPAGFEVFMPHMVYYFLRHVDEYRAVLKGLAEMQGKTEASPLGFFSTTYDPQGLAQRVDAWEQRLRSDAALMRQAEEVGAELQRERGELAADNTAEMAEQARRVRVSSEEAVRARKERAQEAQSTRERQYEEALATGALDEAAGEYVVALPVRRHPMPDLQDLGLVLGAGDARGVPVEEVRPGGLLHQWNQQSHETLRVLPADLIVKVNGKRAEVEMLQELQKSQTLALRLKRPDVSFSGEGNPLPQCGCWQQ